MCDRLNTHQSEALVRWVAQLCGIDEELGVKGESGILASMASRSAYLSDPTHKVVLRYTPKHSSWMNQIEIWLSILVQGAQTWLIHLRRGVTGQSPGLHRLLQPDNGQTVQVDLPGKSFDRLNYRRITPP